MMWTELVKIAHPLLLNLGYECATEKPNLSDDTVIEVPLLIKKGTQQMKVSQCAWGRNSWPTYYKVISAKQHIK